MKVVKINVGLKALLIRAYVLSYHGTVHLSRAIRILFVSIATQALINLYPPLQVTMNPDGTIAGAHGINLTDSSGRIIPVSLSLSLPISSFANSMSTTNSDDSIATSEAAVAASAVHEIFSTQQSETDIDVQLTSGQVIADHIDDTDVIQQQSHDGKYVILDSQQAV